MDLRISDKYELSIRFLNITGIATTRTELSHASCHRSDEKARHKFKKLTVTADSEAKNYEFGQPHQISGNSRVEGKTFLGDLKSGEGRSRVRGI